ncbi:MAG: hypothetical protein ACMVO3_10275 [Thalassobaculum sp.]
MRSPVAREISQLNALHATPVGTAWRGPDGRIEHLTPSRAALRAHETPPVVCHARSIARRLDVEQIQALDVLELFAFVRPATFCLPTPRGLAEAMGLPLPHHLDEAPDTLLAAADALLAELPERQAIGERDRWARPIARAMA